MDAPDVTADPDSRPPMHEDEHPIDEGLARRLLRSQFPHWADQPLRRVPSTGTVNAIYRLGDALSLRLPRTPRWHDIDHEVSVLERVRAAVDLAVPRPVAVGEPGHGYPWRWAVFDWIEGETWDLDRLHDPSGAARRLAEFVLALQGIDAAGGPRSSRGGRTATAALDGRLRQAAVEARHLVDVEAFLAEWDRSRTAPGWAGQPVWVHGDLLAPNLLVRDGELHAAIDWAGATVGDPARDLAAAWNLFDGDSRRAFRDGLDFDEESWQRARSYALTRIFNVAYYEKTNPGFSADAVRVVRHVLGDGDQRRLTT
jgi:aminoglycoside phosphotransferase (APT) family kinase protein